MKKKRLTSLRYTSYGGIDNINQKKQILINHKGRIKIKEEERFVRFHSLDNPVAIDFINIKKANEILDLINNSILDHLIDYSDNLPNQEDDFPARYTLEFRFDDKTRIAYKKVRTNKYIDLISFILNNPNIKDVPKQYQVEFLVRSPQNLKQILLKTPLFSTKDEALYHYSQNATSYVTLGIMRLYLADLLTINPITNERIKTERFIDNSKSFWEEYHNMKF